MIFALQIVFIIAAIALATIGISLEDQMLNAVLSGFAISCGFAAGSCDELRR